MKRSISTAALAALITTIFILTIGGTSQASTSGTGTFWAGTGFTFGSTNRRVGGYTNKTAPATSFTIKTPKRSDGAGTRFNTDAETRPFGFTFNEGTDSFTLKTGVNTTAQNSVTGFTDKDWTDGVFCDRDTDFSTTRDTPNFSDTDPFFGEVYGTYSWTTSTKVFTPDGTMSLEFDTTDF